jgi:outer membrane cobalamin receptor
MIHMLRSSSRASLGAVLFLGCSASAFAQTAGAPENVVVTATHLAGGVSAQDANVAVIDAGQIAARQPSSVVELLRDLPGVYVQQSGGRGSVVSLFTRGAKPNFTLVLLDGVKANDPTNTRGGSYDFSTLDLNDIQRVEMVRGPASAVYGSDAVGGVINIITRRGTPDLQAGLSAEGGSFGYWRAGGHVSGPIGGAQANLGLSYNDSGMPVAGSNVKGTSLDGALELPEIAGATVSVNGRFGSSTATSFPDSSGGPRLSVLRTLDHRDIDEGVLGAHAARAISDHWSMMLDYGLYTRSSDARSPGVAPSTQTPFGIPANTDDARFTRNQLTWTNRFSPAEGLDVAAGMDLQIEHGADDGTLDFGFPLPTHFALDRTLWSAFAEARYRIDEQLSLSASGRYDNNDGDGHFSPQLRADYALPDTGTHFQISWGKAYKLPSFYALGNPIVGDPSLKPEDAETVEGGVTQDLWTWGRWKMEGYDTHYSDLIDFQPGAVPKLVNLSSVHVRGMETSLALDFGAITATPHVSYTNARNALTGAPLRDVPEWLAGASLTWRPIEAAQINLDVTHVGAMIDNSVPTGDVTLGSHVRTDLAVSWRVLPQLKLNASVENLLNARYEDVVGFRAPGPLLRAGISASL